MQKELLELHRLEGVEAVLQGVVLDLYLLRALWSSYTDAAATAATDSPTYMGFPDIALQSL